MTLKGGAFMTTTMISTVPTTTKITTATTTKTTPALATTKTTTTAACLNVAKIYSAVEVYIDPRRFLAHEL